MIELSLELPTSLYDRLQTAVQRENQSINNLLIEFLSERFPPLSPSAPVKNERECSYYTNYQFVTEWALPDQYQKVERSKDLD